MSLSSDNLSRVKRQSRRSGFTLVELLFVIAIIAVLSTMSLGIMRSAQNDAKESATRSRIKAIEAILQIELEDYEVRRLPISLSTLRAYAEANSIHGGTKIVTQVRNLKRRIIADIISAENPRPLVVSGDFVFNPDVGRFPTTQIPLDSTQPSPLGFEDWLNANYPGLAAELNAVRSSKVRSLAQITSANFNLPGEYLYAILQRIDIDGAPSTEQLGPRAVGDSDEDGFPEIVDSWGEPMQLRIWQVDAREVGTDVWEDDPAADFDIADSSGAPTGYAVIDSTVPREVSKIRFQVVSTRLQF